MPANQRRQPVRFLVFAASMRRDSLNVRLAELAAAAIEAGGGDVDVAGMRDFDAPSYDQDVQRDEGFPPGAEEFRRRLEACHGFVVASPEYNASMPGALKNAIDWVSRYQPQPFNERHGIRHRLGIPLQAAAVQRAARAAHVRIALDGRGQPRPVGAARPV